MSSKKRNIYIFLGKVILITLLIVLFVRCFLIESFTVSSSQMETTLYEEDRVLIDKTAYGIRLPVTLLSIPFTFDNIFGLKSYSGLIQMPYTRLFASQLGENEIVLFNNPLETDKPLDKRSLLLGRCVGLPGDSIEMREGAFFINKKPYNISPNTLQEYALQDLNWENIKEGMAELDIPLRSYRRISDTLFVQLNRYEAYMLNECLPDSLGLMICGADTTLNYRFMIPSKGKTIELDENNAVIYNQIISSEQENKRVELQDGKLLIDGVKQDTYRFEDDYYWMLSDNSVNNMDSRILGFIPFKTVIGRARTIWYNPEAALRENRCFSSIK